MEEKTNLRNKLMDSIKENMQKSRLKFLQLEFYFYLEDLGYPDFHKRGNTINSNLFSYEIGKSINIIYDNEEICIPIDKDNHKFKELYFKLK